MCNLKRTTILIVLFVVQHSAQAQTLNPRDQLRQYVADLQRNPEDQQLREKIITFAQAMKPAPETPEEADRFMARGAAAMKDAKAVSDFKEAATEFRKATLSAPWLAAAYYNAGIAESKAENYGGAARNLRFYLLAAPDATDAKQTKTLMYEMEYEQEKVDRANAVRDAEARAQQQRQSSQARSDAAMREKLRGIWRTSGGSFGKKHYYDWHVEIDVVDGELIFTTVYDNDKYRREYRIEEVRSVTKAKLNNLKFDLIVPPGMFPQKGEISDDFTSVTRWQEDPDCNCKSPIWILTRASN